MDICYIVSIITELVRELQNFWKPSNFGIQQSISTVKITAAIGAHECEPGCETQKRKLKMQSKTASDLQFLDPRIKIAFQT